MNNNVYIGIIVVVSYVFLLPLLIIGECVSLFFDNATYSLICSIGSIGCLFGIGILNRQYKSMIVFVAVMAVFVAISVIKCNIITWVAFGWATLTYSALSYLNIVIYWIKKMNNVFYKACAICFLLMFGVFIYIEYLNALNKRYYIIDNYGTRMYDNWTGGVYIMDDGKMYYFDFAKDRKKAIYDGDKNFFFRDRK